MCDVSYMEDLLKSVVVYIITHQKNLKVFPRDGTGRFIWRLDKKRRRDYFDLPSR